MPEASATVEPQHRVVYSSVQLGFSIGSRNLLLGLDRGSRSISSLLGLGLGLLTFLLSSLELAIISSFPQTRAAQILERTTWKSFLRSLHLCAGWQLQQEQTS
jgi:hypothetical protein